jgi:hypothetical protein
MPGESAHPASAADVGTKKCALLNGKLEVKVQRGSQRTPVPDFSVKLRGKPAQKTGPNGIAQFTGLRPKVHQLSSGEAADSGWVVRSGGGSEHLAANQTKTAILVVDLMGSLAVTVAAGATKVGNVRVTATAPDLPDSTGATGADGVATLNSVPCGEELQVSLELVDAEAKAKYVVPPPTRVKVGDSRSGTLTIELVEDPVKVHGRLLFKDPTDAERPFPKGFPLQLKFADGSTMDVACDAAGNLLGADGKPGVEVPRAKKSFGLVLTQAEPAWLACEALGAGAKQVEFVRDPDGTRATGPVWEKRTARARLLKLPDGPWTTENSPWTVRQTTGWADHKLSGLDAEDKAPLGTREKPVEFVLAPVWRHARLEYYDRHLKGPRRLSLPPMLLEGVQGGAGVNTATAAPAALASWLEGTAADGSDAVQCLAWILQEPAKALPDTKTVLRFRTPDRTFVRSEANGTRTLVSAKTFDGLSVERLQHYDLPAVWVSAKWYLRYAPGKPAEEAGRWETLGTKATKVGEPFVFCLDDLILCDHKLEPTDWTPADPFAVFSHRFSDLKADGSKDANLSAEGVWKPDTAAKTPFFTTKPAPAEVEKDRNYIASYPDWTRLVIARGCVFDVFDQRVGPDPAKPARPVGARAAVMSVDIAKPFGNLRVYDFAAGAWAPDRLPMPTRGLYAAATVDPARPGLTDADTLVIQPYHEQQYVNRFEPYDENHKSGTGRTDHVLLRLCDADGAKETSTALVYERIALKFTAPIADKAAFGRDLIANTAARWNGATGDAFNPARPRLEATGEGGAIAANIVRFFQIVPKAQAHFEFDVLPATDPNSRDWRSGVEGTGACTEDKIADLGNWFVCAHEYGHEHSLPDEYNEMWTDTASFDLRSVRNTLPGDPFIVDPGESAGARKAMMNGNSVIRTRYFWQIAEFARQATGGRKFEVVHGTWRYSLPPHPDPNKTWTYWPMAAKLNASPANIAPLTGTRGRADLFCYALGAERFSAELLPGLETPPGRKAYDGLCTVLVKMFVKVPDPADETATQALLLAIEKAAEAGQHKWILTGKARQGSAQAWTFRRALVDVRFCFMVDDPAQSATVTKLKSEHEPSFELEIVGGPFACEWQFTGTVHPEIATEETWTRAATASGRDFAAVTELVAAYHALRSEDLPGRVAALKAIEQASTPESDGTAALPTDPKWAALKGPDAATSASLDAAMQAYNALAEGKIVERVEALKKIVGECDKVTEQAALGTSAKWLVDTAQPAARTGRLAAVDTALAAYQAVGLKNLEGRSAALKDLMAKLDALVGVNGAPPAGGAPAVELKSAGEALRAQAKAKRAELELLRAAAALRTLAQAKREALPGVWLRSAAKNRAETLDKQASSRKLKITATNLPSITSVLKTQLPSMLGAYRKPAHVKAEDLKAMFEPLGLEDLAIVPI